MCELPAGEIVKGEHKWTEKKRVLLTEDNNKCGYELCDECNERLEQSMERGRNEN